MPKSYRPEGQPRSAGNEFPTREVFGNSRQCYNMADFIPSVITYLREQAVNNKRSMFLFIFPRLEYRIKSTALNYFQCFKPRTFREFLDCQPFATILHAHDML